MEEKLLDAWLELSYVLKNERFMTKLSFNEAVFLRYIYQKKCRDGEMITIKELCGRTKLLKSQVNKVVNDLEKRGYIRRIRLDADRRYVYIELTESGLGVYWEEHESIEVILLGLVEAFGDEKTEQVIALFGDIVRVFEKI